MLSILPSGSVAEPVNVTVSPAFGVPGENVKEGVLGGTFGGGGALLTVIVRLAKAVLAGSPASVTSSDTCHTPAVAKVIVVEPPLGLAIWASPPSTLHSEISGRPSGSVDVEV